MNVGKSQNIMMRKENKMIVKACMKFYSKAWSHRNDVFHNKEKHKVFISEWYESIQESMQKGNQPQTKRHAEKQKIDANNCDSACIRH